MSQKKAVEKAEKVEPKEEAATPPRARPPKERVLSSEVARSVRAKRRRSWRFHPPASAIDVDTNEVVTLDAVDAEHAGDPAYWRGVILPKLG